MGYTVSDCDLLLQTMLCKHHTMLYKQLTSILLADTNFDSVTCKFNAAMTFTTLVFVDEGEILYSLK